MYSLLSSLKKFTAYFLTCFIVVCYLGFSQPLFSQINKSVYHPTPAKRDVAKKFQQKKLAAFYSKKSFPGSKNFTNSLPPATAYYVNDNSITGDHYTLAPGNDLFPGTSLLPFRTIQHAIDVASDGDIIYVDAGIYEENIIVNKNGLDIRGSDYGIDPNTGTRTAESIIYPATSDPDYTNSYSVVVYLDNNIDNASIDGFTIDGDNPNLTSDSTVNGANVDACEAISSFTAVTNTHITNNIIQNYNYGGIDFFPPYGAVGTPANISSNKIDNVMGRYAVGILIYNNLYADITNNVLTRQSVGIQTGNFNLARPGNGTTLIDNNSVESEFLGIWHNLTYQSATSFSITNNNMTTFAGATLNEGIEISSVQQTVSAIISDNSVTGARVGLDLWNNPTSATITCSGGTISNCSVGVFPNNYDGYASDADASNYTISGINISNCDTGIWVRDNDLNSNNATVSLVISNSTNITGGSIGMLLEGADASASFSNSSPANFSGQTTYMSQITNGTNFPFADIDAIAVSFEANTGATMTQAQRFATEDKLNHKPDYTALGLITFVANNVFVTPNSFIAPYTTTASVHRGYDVSSAGFTVNAAAGTYPESSNLSITHQVTFLGANGGVSGIGTRSPESEIVYTGIAGAGGHISINTSSQVVIDGFKFTDNYVIIAAGDRPVILVGVSGDHTFTNNIFSRAASSSPYNGSDAAARAIELTSIAAGNTLNITNNRFTGNSANVFSNANFRTGIYYNGSPGTVSFTNNLFEYLRSATNIDDITSTLNVSGNSFANNGTAISIGGSTPPSGSFTFGANDFNGTGAIVQNSNVAPSFYLDITAGSYGGTPFASLSLPQLFTVEALMNHGTNVGRNGLVRVVAHNIYVLPTTALTLESKAGLQKGISLAFTNDTVNVADGVYNEDIDINKQIAVNGQSQNAVVRGLYSGSANSVIMSVSNSTIRNITVTRDYGSTLADWYACTKNQGITVAQTTTGVLIDNVLLTGNRNAIYINNAQNVTVQNSIIEDNRTGIQFANDVSGCVVKNNFIRNNFTHGVLLNYDTPPGITATNLQVNDNSITGNWYSQVDFQHNNLSIGYGDHTGISFSCNWYGTTAPAAVPANAAEPGYTSQVPSQFGGADPGLNRQLYGIEIAKCPYIPWLIDSTDDNTSLPGFQPVSGSCNGTPIIVTSDSVKNVTCYGSSTGGVFISVSGGSGSYTYNWSNGATTQDITNIPSGTYKVIVTDAYGQKDSVTATVSETSTQLIASSNAGTIVCHGSTTTVTVSATGGLPPYSGTGTFTVPAGTYTYTVTDNNGCSSTTTITITQPTQLIVHAVPGTIQCPGGTTTVAVSATGGTPPYTGIGTFTANAGMHTYTVIDGNGCSASITINIPDGTGTHPNTPGPISGAKYNLCGGGNRNYSVAAVAGATSYNWTAPAGFTITGNGSRTVTITIPASFTTTGQIKVSASNNCGSSAQRTLPIYAVAPNPSSAINGPTNVAANQANVQYSLPNAAGLVYTWGVPSGATITSGQGTYKIKVKFGTHSGNVTAYVSNSCGSSPTGHTYVTVSSPLAATGKIYGSASISAYPNPTDAVTSVLFNTKTATKYQLYVEDMNGKQLLQKSGISIAGDNFVKIDVGSFANGVYVLKLITENDVQTLKIVKDK